jgi:serine phosphatase RsbU (regulator of sigma subunit)
MLERLDAHLDAYLPEDSFVTLVATAFDPRTGGVECVNAGHLAPIVLDPRGRVRRLQAAENPALGLGLGRIALASQHSTLHPGETLALYTDGLTELGDPTGEMFGEERLADELSRLVARAPRGTSAELALRLESALDAFRGESMPADDRTFLLARRLPR